MMSKKKKIKEICHLLNILSHKKLTLLFLLGLIFNRLQKTFFHNLFFTLQNLFKDVIICINIFLYFSLILLFIKTNILIKFDFFFFFFFLNLKKFFFYE